MKTKQIGGAILSTGSLQARKIGAFRFTLTRGDGSAVDEGLLSYLIIYNSAGGVLSTTKRYNPTTNVWTVILDHPEEDGDPAGYWAAYRCTAYSIASQYPLRYKPADQWKIEDLIQPGDYTDEIPYWWTFLQTIDAPYTDPICGYGYVWPGGDVYRFGVDWYALAPGITAVIKTRIVRSSVPYRVTESTAVDADSPPFTCFKGLRVWNGEVGPFSYCFPFGGPINHCVGEAGPDFFWFGTSWWDGWETTNTLAKVRVFGEVLDVEVLPSTIESVSVYGEYGSSILGREHKMSVENISEDLVITCNGGGSCAGIVVRGNQIYTRFDRSLPQVQATWNY